MYSESGANMALREARLTTPYTGSVVGNGKVGNVIFFGRHL